MCQGGVKGGQNAPKCIKMRKTGVQYAKMLVSWSFWFKTEGCPVPRFQYKEKGIFHCGYGQILGPSCSFKGLLVGLWGHLGLCGALRVLLRYTGGMHKRFEKPIVREWCLQMGGAAPPPPPTPPFLEAAQACFKAYTWGTPNPLAFLSSTRRRRLRSAYIFKNLSRGRTSLLQSIYAGPPNPPAFLSSIRRRRLRSAYFF